jgi:hypothetical protein
MKPPRAWTRLVPLVLLCATTACRTGGPTVPESSSVNVGFQWLLPTGSNGAPLAGIDGGLAAEDGGAPVDGGGRLAPIAVPSPLRYVLAWAVKDQADAGVGRWIATAGGPIGDLEQGVVVDLVMPSAEEVRLLSPRENVSLRPREAASTTSSVAMARPRILIYEDADEDGRFCPASPGCTGGDRVLGIAGQSSEIAAVLDLEAALPSLSVSSAQAFYAASGGRFTPFIAVTSETPAHITLWQPQLLLFLDGWSYPDIPVACARISGGTQVPRRSFFIDALAVGVACPLEYLDTCEVVALSAIPAPAVDWQRTTRFARTAHCQASGDLQILTVTEQTPVGIAGLFGVDRGVCQGRIDAREATYIASPRALPPWWPCGTQVPF